MDLVRRQAFLLVCLFAVLPAQPQSPAPVIDGQLDDVIWRNLPAEKLVPSEAGVPAEMGGEIRATIVGRYLYVAACLPEPTGRITARMIGRNPNWEDEDLLRVVAGPDLGYTDREVKINPLGAYSVERNGQFVPLGADQYLVATRLGEKEWTVELAFPLNLVSAPGPGRILVSVERIRAARPGSPQLRWHWPQYGPVAKAGVTSGDWNLPAPEFRPSPLGDVRPPLEAGRVKELPPLESGWQDGAWRDVAPLKLLRDEPQPRLPRFSTEGKLLHDGRTLAVLAKCTESGGVLVRTQPPSARQGPEDNFRVYLATSGSAYAQLAINPSGMRQDSYGLTGGPLVSRARSWDSGTRSLVRETAEGWTVRLDIPLDKVAELLGESKPPVEWRILLMRDRPPRDGEPLEISVLPVVQSDTQLCPARYQRLVLSERGPAELKAAQGGVPQGGDPPFETRVLSAGQRKQMNVAAMLDSHLRRRVQNIVQAQDKEWARIDTRAEWERFRDPRIKALAASLGDFPRRAPLQVRVTKEFLGNGYRRQDLVYQSRPGLWVTANLYLPAKPPARMPGFVIVHSHHRPRTQGELQDMGMLWARVGCAVLIMDQIGHGERIQNYPWNREAYHSRYMMGMQLYLAGESLIKWMVWDVMRGVDLLLERKDVNPDQIIVLGAVAAGGEPAAITAALDSRVAAVAPFNFARTGAGWGEWESTRCLRRSIADGFMAWVIDASVAPRRLIYANEMGWESYRVHEAWGRYLKIFGFYGVPDHLDETHGFGTFPGPGECTNIGPTQRQNMYPELNRWFGIPTPPEEPRDRRPEAEMASLTPALAAELHMKPICELGRETAAAKLSAARTGIEKLSPAARREWLRANWAKRLGDIEPNPRPEAISRWQKKWKNASVEALTLEVEPGIIVPLLLLKPDAAGKALPPVVVALSQGGKERMLGDRLDEVEALLNGGAAVCLPDVRGTGETSADPRRGLSGEEDSSAATEFMLGNTLLGARLKDLRTVLAYLRSRSDLDQRRIALWGDTYAPVNPARVLLDEVPGWQIGPVIQQQVEPLGGLLAMLGGLYEDSVAAMAVRKGLAAYLSVLDDNFTYVPNDVIVPGILEVGDLSDVAASLAPRPLLLESLVDGKDRVVPGAVLEREFARSVEAYRTAPKNLVMRSGAGTPGVAAWLLAQLQSGK